MSGLASLTTAILSDSLDKAGLRSQVLSDHLACVVEGTRIVGRARTVEFAPTTDVDPAHPYDDAMDFIDATRPGDLIVVATGESNASAFWGELFSAAAHGRGAVGMVTDGNLRDVDKIRALGFGAFARSARPIDYRGRMSITATQVPVTVGGVVIRPGDLVMADVDGVVVVPIEVEEEVLALAGARASGETKVLEDLLSGVTLRQVWERYGLL